MSYYACSAIKALTPNAYRRRQRKATITGTGTSAANTNGNAKVTGSANAIANGNSNTSKKTRAGTSNRSRTNGLESLHQIKRHSKAKRANANANASASASASATAHSSAPINSKSNVRNANSNTRTTRGSNSRIATRSNAYNHGNGPAPIIPSIPGLSGNVPPPSKTITFGNRVNRNGSGSNGTSNGKFDYAPALSQLTMTQSFSQSMDGTATTGNLHRKGNGTTSSYGNINHKGKTNGRVTNNYQNGKGNANRIRSQSQPRPTSTMSVPRTMVLASALSFSSSVPHSKVKTNSKAKPQLASQTMTMNQKQKMNNNNNSSNSRNNCDTRTKPMIANRNNCTQNRTRNRFDSSSSSTILNINRTQNQSRPRPGPNAGPKPGPGMGRTTRSTSASNKGNSNQARRKMRQDIVIEIEDNDDHKDDGSNDDYNDEDYNLSHNQEETLTSQPLLPHIPSSSSNANVSVTGRSRSMTGNAASTIGNANLNAHNSLPKKRSWMDACVDILSTPYRRTKSKPAPTNTHAGGKTSNGENGNGSNIRANSAAQSLSLANTSIDVAKTTTATTVSADSGNRGGKKLCDGKDAMNRSSNHSNAARNTEGGGEKGKDHVGTGGGILSTAISTFQTPSRNNSSAIVPSSGACADASANTGAESRMVTTSEATTTANKHNGDGNCGKSKGSSSSSNALVPFDANFTAITVAQQQHFQQHHDQMQLQLQKHEDQMAKVETQVNQLLSQLDTKISELTQHEIQLVSSTKATLTELHLQSTTETKEAMEKLRTEQQTELLQVCQKDLQKMEQGATQRLSEVEQRMVKGVTGMEEVLEEKLLLVTSKQKSTMLELEKAGSDQLNRVKEEGMSFWDDLQKRRLEMAQNLEEKRKGMLDEVDRVVKEVLDGSIVPVEGNADNESDLKNGNTRTAANAGESASGGLRERIEMEKNGALDTVRSAVQSMVESMIVSAKEKVDKIWKEAGKDIPCAQEKKGIPACPSPANDAGVVDASKTDVTTSIEDDSKRNCSNRCKVVNSNSKVCGVEARKVTPFHSSNKTPIVHAYPVNEDAIVTNAHAKPTSNEEFLEDCNRKIGSQARKCGSPKEVTPQLLLQVAKAHAHPTGKTMGSDNSNKSNKRKKTLIHVKSIPSEKKKGIQKPRKSKKNNSTTSAAINNRTRTKPRRRKVAEPQTNASKKNIPLNDKSKVDSLPQTIQITNESQQPVSPLRLPDMRAPRPIGNQPELACTTGGDKNEKKHQDMMKKKSSTSSVNEPFEELGTTTPTNQDLALGGKNLASSSKQVSTKKQARSAVRRYNLRSKVRSDHSKSKGKQGGTTRTTSRIEETAMSRSTPVEVAGGAIGTVQTIPDPQFTSQNLVRVKPLRAKQPIAEKLQRKTPSGEKSTQRIPPGVSSSASYSSQFLPDTNSAAHNSNSAAHNSKHTQKITKMLPPSTPTPTSPIKRTPTVTGRKHLSTKEIAPDAPKLRLRRRKRSTYGGRSRTTRTGRNDEGDIHFTSSAAMLSLGNLKISDSRYKSLQLPNIESNINNENAPVMPFTSPNGPTLSLAPRLPDLDELRYRPQRRTTLDIRTKPRVFDIDANDIFEFS